MVIIAISGGTTAGFFQNMRVGRAYFSRMPKMTKKISFGRGGAAHEKILMHSRAIKSTRLAKRDKIGKIILGGIPHH